MRAAVGHIVGTKHSYSVDPQVDDLSLMVQVEGRTFTSSAIAAVIKDALPGNSTRWADWCLLDVMT